MSWTENPSTGAVSEEGAVSSTCSSLEWLKSRAGPGQFLPRFLNECSERGILQPEQRLVPPIVNRVDKCKQEKKKKHVENDAPATRAIKSENEI